MAASDVLHPVRYVENKVDAAARKAVKAELKKWALVGALVYLMTRSRR